jgi:ABC-type Zn2+ transport system substrate-binding protein/surface adhesin
MSIDSKLNEFVQSGVYYNPNRSQIEQAKIRKKIKQEERKEKEQLLKRIDDLEIQIKELQSTVLTTLKSYK